MYTKFEKPIRTEIYKSVGYNVKSEISILGETEKAYLICYNKPIKKGVGVSTYNYATQWIPKSIWDNDKYFVDDYKGQKCFEQPTWIN
tara:strand:+ start:1702 stop:1965 length:264 start_codon:yes stop_codon:yes gene_type:complete